MIKGLYIKNIVEQFIWFIILIIEKQLQSCAKMVCIEATQAEWKGYFALWMFWTDLIMSLALSC